MQENRIEAKDSEVALTIGQTGHVWKRLLCFVFVSHSSLVCLSLLSPASRFTAKFSSIKTTLRFSMFLNGRQQECGR